MRSRFLAFVYGVESEEEAKERLAALRKTHFDARHVCYAYVIGPHGEHTRQNDDGEPSGTAGAPIARQIRSAGLTNVLVAVVRYFGGVKLGTGRLGVAYKTAAAEALAEAGATEVVMKDSLKVVAPYDVADTAMRLIRNAGADITARDYTATETIMTVAVRCSDTESLKNTLTKIHTLHFIDDTP
ncbi:MAG: YigZ family protein [Prevotellaceae bacterium]|nr:YigZ family protein [Prevotellaceae bacterium]